MNIDLLQSFLNSANIFTYEIIENNKASEVYVDVKPEEMETPERTGFTVVEWGGCEIP